MDMLRPPLPGVAEIEDPADDADELDGDPTAMPVDPATGIVTAPPSDATEGAEAGDAPEQPPLDR